MRLVFAGTPSAAVPSLERLAASRHEIVAVVTRPDAPVGRKRVLTPSPVAHAADRLGLPVIRAARLDAEASDRIAELAPDLGVIVAYGGLVREPLLSAPVAGWINLHFSLLPAWRGAAPVQHSLIAGDAEIGASVFRLVPELDAGDVFGELRRAEDGESTAGELLDLLAVDGAGLLAEIVDGIAAGTAAAAPQAGAATFAPKLTVDDGRLDWTQPAEVVLARYRGVTPEPGAWTMVDGDRLKVLEARRPAATDPRPDRSLDAGELLVERRRVLVGTATGPVELVRVQPAGKQAMSAADWGRGLPEHASITG
ncbi:methionyl-tRNA formyltransferase [Agromyces sp. LHK192]|uniref:methionyl-tRNA formyltransferase n=1 Tax=Agromyces sp. LHK192 TaxID=2498704 RepID=UPI000FDADEAB|nr:methionyl-tRNA formyltransferase [Agromyces sp. LHK192]